MKERNINILNFLNIKKLNRERLNRRLPPLYLLFIINIKGGLINE